MDIRQSLVVRLLGNRVSEILMSWPTHPQGVRHSPRDIVLKQWRDGTSSNGYPLAISHDRWLSSALLPPSWTDRFEFLVSAAHSFRTPGRPAELDNADDMTLHAPLSPLA